MQIHTYVDVSESAFKSNSQMAGLFATHRPAAVTSPASVASRLVGFLALLLLISLALFAFFQQLPDPIIRLQHRNDDPVAFPGLAFSEPERPSPSSADCAGVLGPSDKMSSPYYRGWKFGLRSDLGAKICITSTTSAGLEQILPWIFYHKVIGVSNFFLFVEGKAATPAVYNVLKSIPGVRLIRRTRELDELQANSRIWNEGWLSPFFYKPCNYELFVKQTLNMEMGIVMATEASVDWIIHVDTDELIHPAGSSEYSVQKLLSDVPQDVDLVIFPNYESTVERDDVKEPFSEVSMFKKNIDHVPKDVYFGNYVEASHGNPNYFLTYGNGKSAARLQHGLRPNGAHRWHNYNKIPKEISFDEAAVLHYTYAKFSDLTSRRDRCGCKPTKEDVERCFMLQFDRDAFVIASTGTEKEMLLWYHEHVVWDDRELNSKLLKEGVLTRVHTPMVIIQNLRESGLLTFIIASSMSSESNNTSTDTEINTYSSKINDQPPARKVLEFPAIPPQSPPTYDIHLDT